MIRRLIALVGLLSALTGPLNAAEPVRVLAAFTLKPALDAIAERYRQAGGEIVLVYGPSPSLAQQIENGLPADLFMSADAAWTEELARKHLIKPETVTDVVSNHLVLIARKDVARPITIAPGFPLATLIGAGPLAMCDPDSHPAGRYAKASLVALGVWPSVEKKIARAENPLLAVKMVGRGDAPYAIVFATDAATEPMVKVIGTFPEDTHPPIRYPVAIATKSGNPAAVRFLAYLNSDPAIAVFREQGYVTSAGAR